MEWFIYSTLSRDSFSWVNSARHSGATAGMVPMGLGISCDGRRPWYLAHDADISGMWRTRVFGL